MTYVVAVRALCEFTAKAGDLDLRFTPSPTAQEGIAGHTLVTGRRGADYQTEITLSGEFGPLLVRGRADGYDPAQNQLEEIKTHRGDLGRMPANHRNLHWAQVKVYGWLLCRKLGLTELRLALVYFDIGSQRETLITQDLSAAELQAFFEDQCSRFIAWAEQELAHRTARDAALGGLNFPHAEFRPGQRQLAEAVYRANTLGRCLMAQASTGIGKTIGTLFPLLKAAPAQGLDKVFFLAAKTSGRRVALDAVALLKDSAQTLPLRVVELVARDKACEFPELACHGESCSLARGFYDRLPAARAAAVRLGTLDRAAIREVALAHQVCPYYLSQDLVRWGDVVVGDYNYYFDLGGMLSGLTNANGWRVSVLVDEAHNMLDRARMMFTAELDQGRLSQLRPIAPEALKKPLERLQRSWNVLAKEQEEDYKVHAELPEKFLATLQTTTSAITDYMTDHPTAVDPALQNFYFDALHFARMAESFGTHSLYDITRSRFGALLCLRNILPAPFLAPAFAAARSTTLFSATLSPWHFYSDTLGMPADTAWIDVEAPFSADQLQVHVERRISTRYQHRQTSLAPIVDLMARQYGEQPGNYLAFFSSYEYLDQVITLMRATHPQIPLFEQARRMDESERDAFLARFTADSRGIGFAVLGGAFAEGVDLPGARLIGAFIATLGLPQMNAVNEQVRLRMETIFGAGYDYTYLYPGIRKVVQAAGRVIRTRDDRGVVYLIDDRFARPEVQALLPSWWSM